MIQTALNICRQADIFILVGSSLAVYPAAGLINYVPADAPKYIIDPKIPAGKLGSNFIKIEEKATTGVPELVKSLLL